MAHQRLPILDYRGRHDKNMDDTRPKSRVTHSKRGLFAIGAAIPAFVVLFPLYSESSPEILVSDIINRSLRFPLWALPVYSLEIARLCAWLLPSGWARRLLRCLIVALLVFPVTHLIGCRVMEERTRNPIYADLVSPFLFFWPWVAACLLITPAVAFLPRLGNRRIHWLAAGLLQPLVFWLLVSSFHYVDRSAWWYLDARIYYQLERFYEAFAFAVACFATPVLVLLTFSPLEPDKI
jgi:hypothetical protein